LRVAAEVDRAIHGTALAAIQRDAAVDGLGAVGAAGLGGDRAVDLVDAGLRQGGAAAIASARAAARAGRMLGMPAPCMVGRLR
jgi:hypothetical protein